MTTKNNPTNKAPLIILTAGGTGGHVYPAEALATELKKRGYRLALVTDSRGLNNYHGTLSEIPNFAVLSGALVGKNIFFKIKSLIKLGLGVLQALWIIIKEKPVCVVGFGGYASFPCAIAAIILGKKLVIHEQNSVMSRTSRFLSKYATLIAKSFQNTKYAPSNVPSVLTGMPVRESIVALHTNKYQDLPENKFQILILGGSQGAKIFSEVIPQALLSLKEEQRKKLKILQQCRAADVENLKKLYEGTGLDIEIASFFGNMAEIYSHSNLIISRAGASSVSEIEVSGIPSILVPLPTAADDHQTGNAEDLARVDGCILIKQIDFNVLHAAEVISDLMVNKVKLIAMSANAKKVAKTDAAKRLANAIEELIK